MNLISKTVLCAAAIMMPASGALAQAQGPVPGTGDSAAISSSNRNLNASYNSLVGAADLKPSKSDNGRRVVPNAVAASAADIRVGAALRGSDGIPIGTIISMDATQAVVDTGTAKIGVPLQGFGKDDHGLLLNITSVKFAELAAAARARSQAQPH